MSDDGGLDAMLDGFWPYRKTTQSHRTVPAEPVDRAQILAEITDMAHREDAQGDKGTVSGSLYCGDHDHYAFLGEVFCLFSHANVLQRDMYPSATKFEAEIIAMTSDLLHGTGVGVVTSGGSESLITALYSYREHARETRGVTRPNVVLPTTAHVALDKGAHWMGIEVRHAPLTDGYVADVAAMADLIDDQTIALVGSAANYAHGLIDPIEEIAALAQSRGIGMHVDGCLGGWLLPWVEKLGYDVPLWDFRVPGRHVDLGRHAQVRLRAQGLQRAALPQQGPAQEPVLHLPRLAGRPLPLARSRRLAQRRHHRLDVRRDPGDRRLGLPRRGRRHHAHRHGDQGRHQRRHPRARGDRRPDVPRGLQGRRRGRRSTSTSSTTRSRRRAGG